ncbi:MAG: UDP-N-acetylmuramate--L-alanine ligase [Candidatus Omnitrophota bacterium]|nr:MAG: UDP-N-acetylmuramate--L-alanine ligase [Candidatus Omnitrophota bacterium]
MKKLAGKIHMVGIGGIGMSGLSFLLAEMGCKVSGSDMGENNIIKRLRRKGISVNIGHDGSHIKDQGLVVYSSSIRESNPELLAAKSRGTPVISRMELLKMLMDKNKKIVGVTGTHGKTTITAMASLMLEEAGFDPTVLIGGESPHFGGNAKLGRNETLVAEVDESDGRFVITRPTHIVVPNLEREHVEHYRDEAHLVDTFRRFLNAQSPTSTFFYGVESRNLRKIASSYKGKAVSFGFSEKADIYAANLEREAFKIAFDCFCKDKKLGRFTINIPGVHNVLNALAVISLGMDLKIDTGTIKHVLASYKGVKRRFELIGELNGAKIVEDYAHHPTEIRATISAARSLKPRSLIAVFQPHRYTRTKSFYKEFSDSFAGANEVILTKVYSAMEDSINGATSRSIYDIMAKNNPPAVKLLEKAAISRYLSVKAKNGDVVLILGAGDIGKIAQEVIFPKIKGKVLFNEPLFKHTTFRVGGPSGIWVEPEDEAALKKILAFAKSKRKQTLIIGKGSNILAEDAGFDGIAIHLGGGFKNITFSGTKVTAGAGAMLGRLVDLACKKGLKGAEGLVGIPGTVGGAVFMNSGYRQNITDYLREIKVMEKTDGSIRIIKRKNFRFGYRHSNLDRYIILEAQFRLRPGKKEILVKRKKALLEIKKREQPLGHFSAGCVFRNPKGKISAARYIDMSGLKGKRMGNAEVSRTHANFIINLKNAKAGDISRLVGFIRKRVKSEFEVDLVPEIVIL